MKILIVTSAFSHHEGDFRGSFLADLGVQLTNAGHRVSVVAPRYTAPQKNYLPGISRHYYRFIKPSSYYGLADSSAKDALSWITLVTGMALSCSWECIVNRPDVIHAFLVIPAGFVAVVVGRLFGIPVAVVGGGSDLKQWPKRRWAVPFIRFTLARACSVIAIGSDMANTAVGLGASANKVHVFLAPAGISAENLHYDREFNAPHERAIVTVCRLVDGKRVDRLIEAFSQCGAAVGEVKLWIVGDGPNRGALEILAQRLGVAASVRFWGTLPRAGAIALVKASELFVLVSDSEATSYASLEAMALGKPVVASAVGGVPDIIHHGENGYLVPRGDMETLKKSIVALSGDAELRGAMGAKARAFIAENLGPDKIVARLEKIYGDSVGKKQK